MKRRWQARMILVLSCGLVVSAAARGGPYVNIMQPHDCPPTHYSAMHVLMPSLYRWAAWCQGPCRYTFARVLHPDIASTYNLKRYHCPSANPLQFALANYPGLNGTVPASTYQARQRTPRTQEGLPQPREDKSPAKDGPRLK